jgi:hypothetical protein
LKELVESAFYMSVEQCVLNDSNHRTKLIDNRLYSHQRAAVIRPVGIDLFGYCIGLIAYSGWIVSSPIGQFLSVGFRGAPHAPVELKPC